MYLLSGDSWEDRVLDYHRPEGHLRIAVTAWAVVRPITGMYLARPRKWGMLREYLGEFGLRAVIRKVRSRLAERRRNEKYFSTGLGKIISSDDRGGREEGNPVVFIAPAHPSCVERIVLPPDLVRPISPEVAELHRTREWIRFYAAGPVIPRLAEIIGWQPESGRPIPFGLQNDILAAAADYWSRPVGAFRLLPLPVPSGVETSSPMFPRDATRPRFTAVLYGLGNYAKTQIIPGLHPAIRIASVHEVDPTQITRNFRNDFAVSTDPAGEDEVEYDVHLIAGYHHTHAGLAVRALDRGAAAVVEKPVVTTREQLAGLTASLTRTGGRLYSCFQMRYNPLFALARLDLRQGPGDPIHITADVYEIPLPPHHWYCWPNSGSHLVSNGCHWLDHFLFMNDFARPVRQAVSRISNGDTVATVELDNGACLVLHLTHLGSQRIGVQEYMAMRREDRTVTIVNSSSYRAEDRFRIIRKTGINKIEVYRRMYREISRKIIAGEKGDSLESIETTNTLMLDLEEELQRQLRS
ncbi:MAG: Gfo/Idh/MocA family oxidoreductase [PVC group bacterium]